MPKLTPKQARFVEEYLIDLNASAAARRAGYSAKTAEWTGPQLLGKTHVSEAISKAISERSQKVSITQDMVLQRWWQIANVDVNDLVEYRRGPCPDCYGGVAFELGCGDEPDGSCQKCKGEGHGRVHVHDTRKLKGPARLVYDGVQVGRDGIKVLILNRDKALENVARHLGMFVERKEITGKDGGPINLESVVLELTDQELEMIASGRKE